MDTATEAGLSEHDILPRHKAAREAYVASVVD